MEKQEKLEIIADILELDLDELSEDLVLEDADAWDSVAILSVIAVMNERFDRYPSAKEIKQYKTVGDLLTAMQ